MIRLQFSTEDGASSELIRLYSHGWCSHVDIVLPDQSLLGARSDGGVQVRQPGYAAFTRSEVINLPASDEVTDETLSFARAQVGKAYDFTAIEAFVVGRDWREADSWFCSELVAAALEKGGYFVHPLATATEKITPADLYLICSIMVPV